MSTPTTTPSARRRRPSPQECLDRFATLQRRAWRLLQANPEAYRRYWARNLRQRRIHGAL